MNETQINKENICPVCNGVGYTAEHASVDEHGENGECVNCPTQVQCEACEATGVTLQLNLNDPNFPI